MFSWTLLHLLRNPEHLARFENEIARNPPVNHGIYPLEDMSFSEACLRETGRLYGNFFMLRYVTRDLCGPDGTIIPKGWTAVSPMAVHYDSELYDNPGKWDPLRFMPAADGTPNYAIRSRNLEFVMFGAGGHICPAERLSQSLLRSTLWPTLFDNYRLELVDGVVNGEGLDGVGVKPNYGKNIGTPASGEREISIKITKRAAPLSTVPLSAITLSATPLSPAPLSAGPRPATVAA